MSEGSLNDTLRGRHGRTRRGISTKTSIQRVAGAGGQRMMLEGVDVEGGR